LASLCDHLVPNAWLENPSESPQIDVQHQNFLNLELYPEIPRKQIEGCLQFPAIKLVPNIKLKEYVLGAHNNQEDSEGIT
jgi:hypothetical protein